MDKAEKIFKSIEELRGGATEVLSRVTQLKGVLKHNMMVQAKNKSRSQELQNLSSDLAKRVEIFEKEKAEAGNLKKLVEECAEELKLKRDELTHLAELQRLCGEETDRKKDEWALVLEGIRESEKQVVVLNEEIEVKSLELGCKEKDLGVVREAVALSSSELELKRKMVMSLNNEITVCAQKIDSKSRESGEILKLIEEQTSEVVGMEKKHKEMLESIKAAETEASCFYVRSERFRQEIEGKQKELDVVKNQVESEEKKLVQVKGEMEEVTGLRKKDLELTLSRIEESGQQLVALNEQLDLRSKELEEIERELKLKRCLRQMNTVFVKREKQPISDSSSQQDAEEETEPIDTFMLHGISASLISSVLRASPNAAEFVLERVQDEIREGSSFQDTFLETLVLIFEELVKTQQLDDVAKTQGTGKSQLQATEVATLWKEKITIEAPKSTLEVLAFLLFIMAYGLKTLMNEEETALLACSIAKYEQVPILFEYLNINLTIREVVEELIKKSEYISAVRLICLFTLDNEVSFSPSELLKKEIISFRRSALENRSTGSSQAKEKDGGRLRAILELVADYKLEIDLPGDLMAKLMVEGERSVRLVSFSVEHDTSSLTPQAELKKKQLGSSSTTPQAKLKKKQLGQVKTVLVKHTVVDEETLGTTLTADVNSSNETCNPKHPPIIHTFQRRRNRRKGYTQAN